VIQLCAHTIVDAHQYIGTGMQETAASPLPETQVAVPLQCQKERAAQTLYI
jgi:hypothetical protein